jgi:diguanylate cyclase (GGDEF)-like protein
MGAISASLNPDDVCAIAARVLYDHAPYLRISFALAHELGDRTIVYTPTEPTPEAPVIRHEGDSVLLPLPSRRRVNRYSFALPEGLGSIEICFAEEDGTGFSDLFLTNVMENFAVTLKNALEFSKVKELAMRDGLTGLFNRRVFDEMLSIEGQRPELMPLSLLLIDLDNFKGVNDTFGHPAGDQVLATVGRILREGCRGSDLVARYGGEEFAVMLPVTPAAGAFEVAQRLRNRLAATTFVFDGQPVRLTASIGVASLTDVRKSSIGELVRRADHALYRAKKSGKNRTLIYAPKPAAVPLDTGHSQKRPPAAKQGTSERPVIPLVVL